MTQTLDRTSAPDLDDDPSGIESTPAPDAGRFVVIGAGPAGLTAAYEAAKRGLRPLVLEKSPIVGGISRTETYKGYGFDMGGHRFFSKSVEVQELWKEMLAEAGETFLRRPRLSRIFYQSKFFNYPLKPLNALRNLGVYESAWLTASYLRWRVRPHKKEENFEEWVVNRFGRRLFRTFFKTYTEKVWGISTTELKAEWAAQRIKDLSLKSAVIGAIWKPKHGQIKTLIEEFDYPRRGPGMLWEACVKGVERLGGEVRMNAAVKALHHGPIDGADPDPDEKYPPARVEAVTIENADGSTERVEAAHVVSTMPLTELVRRLDPEAPLKAMEASLKLKYRDFLTVCVIVDDPDLFPDNWIYIHDPSVQVGRIQNFKNWSPEMVPEADRDTKSSLGLEYFCNEGDALWSMDDDELVRLAARELEKTGLTTADKVVDGVVYRVPKSYPVYDGTYAKQVEKIRRVVDKLSNVRTVGRNGLHRYNNQDHSMLSGLYSVAELVDGERHDLWSINADQEYHEEVKRGDRTPGQVGRNVAASTA